MAHLHPMAPPSASPLAKRRDRVFSASSDFWHEQGLVCGAAETEILWRIYRNPDPSVSQIEAARRAYDNWWQALRWIRERLIAGGILREVKVTEAVPKRTP